MGPPTYRAPLRLAQLRGFFMPTYKDHKGRYVSKEVYDWLQKEAKAAKAQKKRKGMEPKEGFDYPEGFVEGQYKARKARLQREEFKKVTKGGVKAGKERTRSAQLHHKTGTLSKPVVIERTKTYETRVYMFEGLQGESATLHTLDVYEDLEGVTLPDEIMCCVSIEIRGAGLSPERVGSPYGTIKQTKNWIVGWSARASGQKVFDQYDEVKDQVGARMIWELEVKIPQT